MKTKTLALITIATLLVGGAVAQTQQPTRNDSDLNAVLINTDPVPVQSGEDAEINFKVVNQGGSVAEDVEVSIVDSYPFELKPDRKRTYSVGDIGTGDGIQLPTAEVLVSDEAPDGSNELEIQITRGDLTHTETVPVQVQSQDIELNMANLETTPSQLSADTDNARATVEVVNNGEKTAENVVTTIELPENFEETSSFSTRQALGNIEPGQVKAAEFTFNVEENAGKGTKDIPANISYSTEESDTKIVENSDFSLYLAGQPQFNIVEVESDLESGTTGQVRLTVENTGSEEASSARIRVLDSSDQPFSYSSSSQYIGTLGPSQNGTAEFEVTTENAATAKDYLVDFEIRGVKGTETYVDDQTARVNVDPQTQRQPDLPIAPIAIVIAVLAGLYFFRARSNSSEE